MANAEIERLLNEIGNVLAQDTSYPLDGTFLYAEVESQMVGASIFKDLGDHLLYRWPMKDLTWVLLDLWEEWPADKRWDAMIYRIEGGKFDASFLYAEELGEPDGSLGWRPGILQRYYGNKRIDYPPLV